MKTFLFFCIILLTKFESYAQNNYLKNYKAPDFGFRQLDLKLNSSTHINFDIKSATNFNSLFYYKGIKNSKKVQRFQRIYLKTDGFYDESNKNQTYKSIININLSHSIKRKYFMTKKWFFGISDYSRYIQSNSSYKTPLNSEIQNNYTLYLKPGISIGHGRLEPIMYARKTLDIEKALIKSHTITNELSSNQKIQLSDLLAKITNKRYFDSRIQRIKQLTKVDSLLQTMNIINKTDIKYFSYLSDAYTYSHLVNRLSGHQFEFELVQSNKLAKTFDFTTFANVSFAYYIPVSYSIQHDFKLNLLSRVKNNNPYINLSYHFGYYPTTRTFVDVTTFMGKSIFSDAYKFGIRAYIYYYFSPKLRGLISGQWSYFKNKNYDFYAPAYFNNFNQTSNLELKQLKINLGINYAIF